MSKVKGLYTCSKCARRFDNETNVNNHIRDKHDGRAFFKVGKAKSKKIFRYVEGYEFTASRHIQASLDESFYVENSDVDCVLP